MKKIRLLLEYDGTGFEGFQLQKEKRTVQKALEEAIGLLTGENSRVNAAGRTDAGVHALGQVVHFQTLAAIPDERWAIALNTVLPQDVRVLKSERVDPSFHSRFDAVSRKYRYRILPRKEASALLRNQVWQVAEPLDRKAMEECLAKIEGLHDFSSFMNAGSKRPHALSHVYEARLLEREDELHVEIRAKSFVYRMIRNLVGALVEVGRGRMSVEEFEGIFQARDRRRAPAAAPPQGLYFMEATYTTPTAS